MRMLYREWKTPRGGFTHRIRWYQEKDGSNIRLELCDPDGERHVFPPNQEEASRVWATFKATMSVAKTISSYSGATA